MRTIFKLYRAFLASSLAFTLDTLYLNWNTTFPAVTVCEIYNGEKNWDISENYFGVGRDHRIDDYVADITFFSGKCHTCSYCEDIACPTNFEELISNFRTACRQLITNCSWIGEPFDCCSEFRPLNTEYGLCYSFNSLQTEPYSDLKFINNRETGPGSLRFALSEDTQIHVHPPNDIPYMMSEGVIRETVLWGSSKEIIFNAVEILNDPAVKIFSPEHRKCRFYNEIEERGENNECQ
ncbi:unnamed protein product [Hermetia illucens]|uniref:Uncharacterized protein n=1 Tax=Hermetia illucens TaxID=343691 RepID=A0A7R8UPP4_HERIL|nr:unnamed protein product [Hermetia illucens]